MVNKGCFAKYTAVPQHDFEIGFWGEGKTVETAIADLNNSLLEARKYLPDLPNMEWDLQFDLATDLPPLLSER